MKANTKTKTKSKANHRKKVVGVLRPHINKGAHWEFTLLYSVFNIPHGTSVDEIQERLIRRGYLKGRQEVRDLRHCRPKLRQQIRNDTMGKGCIRPLDYEDLCVQAVNYPALKERGL